jgi:fumarylacetoacetate (FAA) hydrolase
MKFIQFSAKSPRIDGYWPAVGLLQGDRVVDVTSIVISEMSHTLLPQTDMLSVLDHLSFPKYAEAWRRPIEEMQFTHEPAVFSLSEILIERPFRPTSIRDFYAFEQHVKSARARRGLEMIPEWYELPVFYYSNPQMIYGPNYTVHKPHKTECLDFELEVAAIISPSSITGVQDTAVEEAESHIVGYTIMNDWSARDIQRKEMAVGLGPAKGKDFATSLGPWIVTPDELEDRRSGKGYDLQMVARRNGVEISRGNWNTIYWSFAEMIARASEDCMLFPGDVIGSGTVGTGCILELGSENVGGWLQPGDVIELEIERLGVLRNTIGEPSKSRM